MIEIPLVGLFAMTNNLVALVDDEDYDGVILFNWHAMKKGRMLYACSERKGIRCYLHHYIFGKRGNFVVDHKDRDGLNNQKQNLRFITHSQNHLNQEAPSNNTSGYKGVYRDHGKWVARLEHQTIRYMLGRFVTPEEAALAYNKKLKELDGEVALFNEVLV